jgi:uncharacterized protein YrrD
MKVSRLRDMAVVSIEDAEKIGTVSDLLVNPDGQRVLALRVKGAQGQETNIVPVEEIASIGKDAITIHDTRGIAMDIEMDEGTVYLSKLTGTKVLTRSGDLLGTVAEVEFDPYSFDITGYELSTGTVSDLVGSRKRFPASDGVHYGKDILIVGGAAPDQYDDREVSRSSEQYESRQEVEEVPPVREEIAPRADGDVVPESERTRPPR